MDVASVGASVGRERSRLPALDMLRGVAILFVLLWHYVRFFVPAFAELPWPLNQSLNLAWMGVDLFFVLSGFLIGGILMDNVAAANLFRVFYARRALRILPAYFLSLVCLLLISHGDWWDGNPGLTMLFKANLPIWSYFLFLQNFFMAAANSFGPHWLGITWSLAIEEQFYLVLPIALRLIKPSRVPILCIACIVGAPILRWMLIATSLGSPIGIYVLLPCRMDSLFLGVLVAWIVRNQAGADLVRQFRLPLRAVFVASVCGLFAIILANWQVTEPRMALYGYSLGGLCSAYILYFAYHHPSRIDAIPGSGILRHMGLWCFSIYLFQQPVLFLVHGLLFAHAPHTATLAETLATLASAATTLLIAATLWRCIEKPLISLGHRWRYEHSQPPPQSSLGATDGAVG